MDGLVRHHQRNFVKRRCLHVIVKRELETYKLILTGVWESGSGDPSGGTPGFR